MIFYISSNFIYISEYLHISNALHVLKKKKDEGKNIPNARFFVIIWYSLLKNAWNEMFAKILNYEVLLLTYSLQYFFCTNTNYIN